MFAPKGSGSRASDSSRPFPRGEQPGSEASIGKIVAANQLQDVAHAGVELLDQFGIISDPDLGADGGGVSEDVSLRPSHQARRRDDEIMKNIIAERILGLPGDVRVDKDTAFRDIPTRR